MTDNEKRAHDLAIAVCTDVCHLKRQSQVDAGKTHVTIDYFEEYINAYESALEAFNEKISIWQIGFLLIKHVNEIGFFDVRTILEAFFLFFFLLMMSSLSYKKLSCAFSVSMRSFKYIGNSYSFMIFIATSHWFLLIAL